ncbi:hypothetical protein JAAARDRAFT_200329 [Jaapia argillacea MUCL 33604]|uniref:Uncharacterized protein n=1 Tax=Jaapia argillacea MUCL 33604 TaxID=933084 RepID=A0A067P858_9AGAM|nr:hypothetical protein JAAARDRAFT_200329 [Jaapia argillacea MUCL 33604]
MSFLEWNSLDSVENSTLRPPSGVTTPSPSLPSLPVPPPDPIPSQGTVHPPVAPVVTGTSTLRQCPRCTKQVTIRKNGNDYHFLTHIGSKQCDKEVKWLEKQRLQAEIGAQTSNSPIGLLSDGRAGPSHSQNQQFTHTTPPTQAVYHPEQQYIPSHPPAPASQPSLPYPLSHLPLRSVPLTRAMSYEGHLPLTRPTTPPTAFSRDSSRQPPSPPYPPSCTQLQEENVRVGSSGVVSRDEEDLYAAMIRQCTDISVEWRPGSLWDLYPFQNHAYSTYGWEPVSIKNDHWIRLRSIKCLRQISTSGTKSCLCCAVIPSTVAFRTVVQRAEEALAHTVYKYLSSRQLLVVLRRVAEQYRMESLRVLNLSQKLDTMLKRTNDYQRINMLLATNDFQRLQQLIVVALRWGASPCAIIVKLGQCINCTYHATGSYNDRELDVAFLVKAIGGPRLLYTLQKSYGLVSYSTVLRNRHVPDLIPSVTKPQADEIDANIASFFGEEQRPMLPLCGHSIFIDGIVMSALALA